jgi:uncharacterized protein YndB with AHSA1/START domain
MASTATQAAPRTPARRTTAAVLKLTRRFRAPPERVFRAFTDLATLQKWWGPKGFTLPKARLDPRPGGTYRFDMHAPSGSVHVLTGTFREVVPPRRLVYSWIWLDGDMKGGETLVTLEFRPWGAGTELRLVHEGFPGAAARNSHRGGWSQCFDRLGALLRGRAVR